MSTSFCSRAAARPALNLRRPLHYRPTNNLTQRLFHSHEHPPPAGPFTEVESAILCAGYKHVPEHGFTTKAIGLGAKDAGYRDISPSVLPDGAFGLVRWHLATQREGLKGRVKAEVLGNGALTAQDKVEHVTWERLLANQDIIHRWQEALAIMAQPSYVPKSLHELALLSDEILHLSGDVSVDPSWYTKRASLSTAYASAELFMTNDASPGFSETKAFLQRRLEAASTVGGAVKAVGQWVGFTMGADVSSDYVVLGYLTGQFGPQPYPKKQLKAYSRVHDVAGGSSARASLELKLGSLGRVADNGDMTLFPGDYALVIDNDAKATFNFTLTGEEVILDHWPQPPPVNEKTETYWVGGYPGTGVKNQTSWAAQIPL